MRTAVLVVLEIVPQYTAQASSVENDDVVQAFTPNRTDQALDVGVLPRRLRSREDFAYAQPFYGLTKLSSTAGVHHALRIRHIRIHADHRDALRHRFVNLRLEDIGPRREYADSGGPPFTDPAKPSSLSPPSLPRP